MKQTKFFVLAILLLLAADTRAQNSILLSDTSSEVPLSNNYFYLVDTFKNIPASQIVKYPFIKASNQIPVFDISVKKVWIQFELNNQTKDSNYYLDLKYTNLSKISLYRITKDSLKKIDMQGNALPLSKTDNLSPNFVFQLRVPVHTSSRFMMEVESIHPIMLPAYFSNKDSLVLSDMRITIIVAFYCGIIGTMLLYNLFLFFSVRDKNYLIYSIYTFSLLLAQLTFAGYSYKYLWPTQLSLNKYAVVVTSGLSFVMATWYSYNFLQIKQFLPKARWIFNAIIIVFFISIILNLLGFSNLSYNILNYSGILSCILVLLSSIAVAKKGFTPAYLYLIAWSSLFMAVIFTALRNLNVIPYNNISASIIYFGSAIETILLSFALANKISVLRREKDDSQAQALLMLKQNEQLIREQNSLLEMKIEERTFELKETNNNLQTTLKNLTDAQIQLVESEKMASLGQLTAGIAHEINNPINFVKSNVNPLQMDVQDLFELISEYQKLHGIGKEEQPGMLQHIKTLENKLDPDFLKEEIESLIGGIEEGAERTAEIVRGLRNFSRLDESEMKEVNVYDNINSTLVLLRNTTPPYLKIRKHFEARAEIECYPGKLNQVFMNILTNCIQAIKAKPVLNEEEYIDISATEVRECLRITISDTGIGMSDEVKRKIFDPFFTTKDVGEGTGLGMSIVFKIIEKHHGKIHVKSLPGEGATFIIDIPYRLKAVAALAEEEAHS